MRYGLKHPEKSTYWGRADNTHARMGWVHWLDAQHYPGYEEAILAAVGVHMGCGVVPQLVRYDEIPRTEAGHKYDESLLNKIGMTIRDAEREARYANLRLGGYR